MKDTVRYPYNSDFSETKLFPGATSGEVVKILDLSYGYISTMKKEVIEDYGKNNYEHILKKSIWDSKSLLSFDDFYKFPSIRNNIHCFFYNNYVGEVYRSQSFYKKFAKENPELEEKLKEIFNGKSILYKFSRIQINRLYQAYEIMHGYDEIKTNHDLFA